MAVTRIEVIQGILSLFPAPNYLEIGVDQGLTFNVAQAAKKVGVDPTFRFDLEAAKAANPNGTYHAAASDDYFGRISDERDSFDVVYVDGLHTAEQTLRDLLNAIAFLAPGGVVIIDDVFPNSFLAAVRERETFFKIRDHLKIEKHPWMGDVYKLLYFIDTYLQQYTFRIIGDNHGQAVIWRTRRPQVTKRLIEQVGRKTYEDLVMDKELFRRKPFAEIVEELKAYHAERREAHCAPRSADWEAAK